jgi:2-dehydropantoate 2-reductase
VIVSVQNGLNEETIARMIGAERTIGAVTRISAALVGPGHVREMREPVPFGLGELDGQITARLRRIAALMEPAAPCELTDNIWGKLWSKLMLNAVVNPTCGVSGLTAGQAWEHPTGRRILFRVCQEGVAVGQALGIRFEPTGGLDMELVGSRDPALRPQIEEQVRQYARASQLVQPSMLQDLSKGRRTEIDYLNGYVVRKAREIGLAAPVNAALVRMVREIETGQRPIAVENLEELARQVEPALADAG